MFDFIYDETGSKDRYLKDKKPNKFIYKSWWIIHNCIAHPLIGFIPIKLFFNFHDWTSRKLHQYN